MIILKPVASLLFNNKLSISFDLIRKYSILRNLRSDVIFSKQICKPVRLNSKHVFNSGFLRNKSFEVNTNVNRDVILFKHDNPNFYKFLNAFGITQFVFWTYLSYFAYTSLKDAPASKSDSAVWWRRINLGENKYRNSLTVLSFIIGYGLLAATWMYTVRSVRYLILRRGGKEVSFVTYTPFGENRIMTVDLKFVSCQTSRHSAPVQIPIKVKNRLFYYMLDVDKGHVLNPKLFDNTAGLKRNLNKL